MWYLIVVSILANGAVDTQHYSTLKSLEECFEEREYIVSVKGNPFFNNYQAVCINVTNIED